MFVKFVHLEPSFSVHQGKTVIRFFVMSSLKIRMNWIDRNYHGLEAASFDKKCPHLGLLRWIDPVSWNCFEPLKRTSDVKLKKRIPAKNGLFMPKHTLAANIRNHEIVICTRVKPCVFYWENSFLLEWAEDFLKNQLDIDLVRVPKIEKHVIGDGHVANYWRFKVASS